MHKLIENFLDKSQVRPTIHLHIGTHKTGTTSLQKFLYTNKKVLNEHDILYPQAGWYHYSQHLLAFQLKGTAPKDVDDLSDKIWVDFHKEIKKSKRSNVIISSEIFATFNKNHIMKLKTELSNYNVVVYLYLRRQDELFESMYNQQVKEWRNTRKEGIPYFMNKMNKLYSHFNYFQLVNNWATVFGKNNIHIRPYHKEFVVDTVTDFINLLGIDKEVQKLLGSTKNENSSVSRKALEMIRLSKFIENDREIREKVYNLANKVFPSTKSNRMCVSIAVKNKITDRFRQSNEKLIKQYFNEGKGYLLLSVAAEEDNKPLTKQDLLHVITSLIKKEFD